MKTVCGLDVHKSIILLCILKPNDVVIIKEFTTLTDDQYQMKQLMIQHRVEEVGHESTGIFWIPAWMILQGQFDLILINPYFIKQIPGRKTDIKDAQWIATIIQMGLVKGSYIIIPPVFCTTG